MEMRQKFNIFFFTQVFNLSDFSYNRVDVFVDVDRCQAKKKIMNFVLSI